MTIERRVSKRRLPSCPLARRTPGRCGERAFRGFAPWRREGLPSRIRPFDVERELSPERAGGAERLRGRLLRGRRGAGWREFIGAILRSAFERFGHKHVCRPQRFGGGAAPITGARRRSALLAFGGWAPQSHRGRGLAIPLAAGPRSPRRAPSRSVRAMRTHLTSCRSESRIWM